MTGPVRRSPDDRRGDRHEIGVEAQARYARRLGEELEVAGDDGHFHRWKIHSVVTGSTHHDVILQNAAGATMSMPARELERRESDGEVRPVATTVRVEDLPSEPVPPPAGERHVFKRRYGAIDVSEAVEDRARDTAEEALHREKSELRGVSGFLARILKHNIGYEIARQIGINRSRERILSEKNLYANDGMTRAEHERATDAVVSRFIAEHDEYLHQDGPKGEKRKVFGDRPEEKQVKQDLNALVREFAANPAMTEEELDARKQSILNEAQKLSGEAKGQGLMYADNIRRIGQEVREAAAHAGGVDNLDIDLEFVVGKAKLGARTEREKNMVDTVLEKMERWGKDHNVVGAVVGAFRNELAVALSATAVIGNIAARVLSSNVAKAVTFGGSALVTGVYSWFREKGRLNRERSLHERQMALGGSLRTEMSQEQLDRVAEQRAALSEAYRNTPLWRPDRRISLKRQMDALYTSEQPRRAEMERFAMARANAKDLAYGALGFFTPEGTLKPDVDPAIAMQALADMEARVRISNVEQVDLLRYSSVAEAEVERRNLDAMRMQLKAALRAGNPNFQTQYDEVYRLKSEELYTGENAANRETKKKFEEWSRRQALKRAVTTVAIGAGIGYVGHEMWAMATDNQTVTGSVVNWLKGFLGGEVPPVAGAPTVETIAGGAFTSPAGTHFVPQPDGSFALETIADHRVLASGLHIDGNGVMDAASISRLEDIGATVIESDTMISHTETLTERVGVWEWLHRHAPSVTHIHRDVWMGNDTPMEFSPELQKWIGADYNELELKWGNGGVGVNPDGDIVMSMKDMTSWGSWNGADSADAPAELLEGKMRLVLTMSESSQNHAVEIVINADGEAVIPANSDIARTFFTTDEALIRQILAKHPELHHEPGAPFFLGRYAEVAVSRGFDEQGTDHLAVLATHVGRGLKEGIVSTDIGESIPQHVTQVALNDGGLVLPPIVPIRGRRPLERLAPAESTRGPLPMYTEPGGAYFDNYYIGEGREVKTDRVEVARLRPIYSERITKKIVAQCKELSAREGGKYDFVFRRLEELEKYDHLTPEKKEKIDSELRAYNLRYFGSNTGAYIGIDEYIGKQITRSHRQLENILLENAGVGDKPFPSEFYADSPVIRGINRAEEIVIVIEPSIGDTVLTVPAVTAIDKYLENHSLNDKKIVVVTKNTKLLQGLELQYPAGRVEMISYQGMPARFAQRKERYVVNVNARLQNYDIFNMTQDEGKSLEHVMSVEWSSWTKEEVPEKEGRIKKYDPIPYRIMRNFELMLGEKLFDDLADVDHFIERGPKFTEQEVMLRSKYNILPGEKVIAITHGSQVKPKEYHPDQWREVVKLIFAKYPNAHILWLESPEAAKRAEYETALTDLTPENGYKISRVGEGMEYMNTIMNISDLSITPDTGIGHFSGAVGTPNVMLTLVDPVQWSTAKTKRVMHRKAYETYKRGVGAYAAMWHQPKDFYVEEDGEKIGASNIAPQKVFEKVEEILG